MLSRLFLIFPANHTVLTPLNGLHYGNRSSYTSYDRYIRPLHKYGGGQPYNTKGELGIANFCSVTFGE